MLEFYALLVELCKKFRRRCALFFARRCCRRVTALVRCLSRLPRFLVLLQLLACPLQLLQSISNALVDIQGIVSNSELSLVLADPFHCKRVASQTEQQRQQMTEALLALLALFVLTLISLILLQRDDRRQVQFCLRTPQHMSMRYLRTRLCSIISIFRGRALG